VSDNLDPRGGDSLREVETEARRLASDAREARDENARGTRRGQETDYAFRLPPDVAHADRVRSGDDVELMDRQAQAAESQRQAAEALRQNAERLQGTARELDRAVDAVRENRGDVRDVQRTAEQLRAQTGRAAEMVARAEVPKVDEDADAGSDR
jgi:hypothetical protein